MTWVQSRVVLLFCNLISLEFFLGCVICSSTRQPPTLPTLQFDTTCCDARRTGMAEKTSLLTATQEMETWTLYDCPQNLWKLYKVK